MLLPEQIIGAAAIAKLSLAGWEVVRRPADDPEIYHWSCPHCGAVHAPKLGQRADVYADWGEVWHQPCAPFGTTAPSKRGDLRPMTLEIISGPDPLAGDERG